MGEKFAAFCRLSLHRGVAGSSPARMCSVPRTCSAISRTARDRPARASRRRGGGAARSRRRAPARGCAIRAIRSPIALCASVIAADQRRRVGRFGERDVQAHVRAAGTPRSPRHARRARRTSASSARPPRRRRARPRASRRRARRRGAGRTSRAIGASAAGDGGRRGGGCSLTNVPPPRPRVA